MASVSFIWNLICTHIYITFFKYKKINNKNKHSLTNILSHTRIRTNAPYKYWTSNISQFLLSLRFFVSFVVCFSFASEMSFIVDAFKQCNTNNFKLTQVDKTTKPTICQHNKLAKQDIILMLVLCSAPCWSVNYATLALLF